VDALKAMVGAPNQKIMLLPMEATGILGSLAGIAELAKNSLADQQSQSVLARPQAPPPPPRPFTPATS
jgi:hypothetical protein